MCCMRPIPPAATGGSAESEVVTSSGVPGARSATPSSRRFPRGSAAVGPSCGSTAPSITRPALSSPIGLTSVRRTWPTRRSASSCPATHRVCRFSTTGTASARLSRRAAPRPLPMPGWRPSISRKPTRGSATRQPSSSSSNSPPSPASAARWPASWGRGRSR